jgi:hypothetical protein
MPFNHETDEKYEKEGNENRWDHLAPPLAAGSRGLRFAAKWAVWESMFFFRSFRVFRGSISPHLNSKRDALHSMVAGIENIESALAIERDRPRIV